MALSGHKNIFNTKIGIQYLFMVPRFYGDDAWIHACEAGRNSFYCHFDRREKSTVLIILTCQDLSHSLGITIYLLCHSLCAGVTTYKLYGEMQGYQLLNKEGEVI